MILPEMKSVASRTATYTEKTGKRYSEIKKTKMTPTRNNVIVAKANVPTIRNRHIYPIDILNKIKTQAESHSTLYCSGVPNDPGALILSDICYQAKNFRIVENCLLCDMHRLKVNEHIDTVGSQVYFHVYGVGDINKQNQITDFVLLGICTYSEPIYTA
jgi:hypothetical protein